MRGWCASYRSRGETTLNVYFCGESIGQIICEGEARVMVLETCSIVEATTSIAPSDTFEVRSTRWSQGGAQPRARWLPVLVRLQTPRSHFGGLRKPTEPVRPEHCSLVYLEACDGVSRLSTNSSRHRFKVGAPRTLSGSTLLLAALVPRPYSRPSITNASIRNSPSPRRTSLRACKSHNFYSAHSHLVCEYTPSTLLSQLKKKPAF